MKSKLKFGNVSCCVEKLEILNDFMNYARLIITIRLQTYLIDNFYFCMRCSKGKLKYMTTLLRSMVIYI